MRWLGRLQRRLGQFARRLWGTLRGARGVVSGTRPVSELCLAGIGSDPGPLDRLLWPDRSPSCSQRFSQRHRPPPGSNGTGRLPTGRELLGRFEILRLLGRGGIGEVYLAHDRRLDELVALKLLSKQIEQDEAHLALLPTEVKYARSVVHASVCRVYDFFDPEDVAFFSMEYIEGESLRRLLRRIGKLHVDKALELGSQLAWGLAAIHRKGILHGDLKPANVMIDDEGRIKITDFGLAGLTGASRRIRGGSPAYMAPELFSDGYATESSDLYSLGLVLYEMFTGRHPFEGNCPAHADRARPPDLEIDLDPSVEQTIFDCLDADPALRPPSADAVATVIQKNLPN